MGRCGPCRRKRITKWEAGVAVAETPPSVSPYKQESPRCDCEVQEKMQENITALQQQVITNGDEHDPDIIEYVQQLNARIFAAVTGNAAAMC